MHNRLNTSIPGSKPKQSTALSDKVTSVGKMVGPETSQTLVKSCVSLRVRSHRVDCFLGVSSRDGSAHYLVCEPIWTISLTFAKLPTFWLLLSVVQCLGIDNPHPTQVYLMAAASRWYLAIRLDSRDLIIRNHNSNEHDSIPKLLSTLARICISELSHKHCS